MEQRNTSHEAENRLKRLRHDLARAVRSVCPPSLAGNLDDIVQTAMLRLAKILEESEGDRELSTSYLYKTAYNAVVDELRRMARRREVPLGPDVPAAPADVDPERELRSRQIADAIHACLARLREARRLAVTLYMQGHTVPESARILDWTLKRTENLVYRGLTEVRACLEAKGVAP